MLLFEHNVTHDQGSYNLKRTCKKKVLEIWEYFKAIKQNTRGSDLNLSNNINCFKNKRSYFAWDRCITKEARSYHQQI